MLSNSGSSQDKVKLVGEEASRWRDLGGLVVFVLTDAVCDIISASLPTESVALSDTTYVPNPSTGTLISPPPVALKRSHWYVGPHPLSESASALVCTETKKINPKEKEVKR